MGRQRYGSLRYGELKLGEYHRNYIQWLSRTRLPRPNTRGARPRQSASVSPYGFHEGVHALVNRPEDIGILASILIPSNKAALDTPPREEATRIKGFSPARVAVEYGPDTFVVSESEITGIRYRRFNALTRFAAPFGRANPTDLEFEARNLIANRFFELQPEAKIRRITFREEQRKEYQ